MNINIFVSHPSYLRLLQSFENCSCFVVLQKLLRQAVYIYIHIRKCNIIEYLCTNLYYNFVLSDAWMCMILKISCLQDKCIYSGQYTCVEWSCVHVCCLLCLGVDMPSIHATLLKWMCMIQLIWHG